MTTKKLLAAQAFFRRNVQDFLESVGAVKNNDGYVLHTSIGRLNIWVFENWIACRYEDVFAATVFTRGVCNRFTGKWNWIYHDDPVTLNNGLIIGDFVQAIEKLLSYSPTVEEIRKANRLRRAASLRRMLA
jgi:hypothetical protein